MLLQNQITVATVADMQINIQKVSTWVDNVTTLVEGMVGAQTHDEVQPTVASVFGRLVDPIGGKQPHVHRNSRSNPIVGGQPVSAVSQSGVMNPNRGDCSVFRHFWGPRCR